MNKRKITIVAIIIIVALIILTLSLLIFRSGVSGTILNEDKNPIEGAAIVINDQIINSNENGKWKLKDKALKEKIIVMAEGYETYNGLIENEIILKRKPFHTVLTFVYEDNGPLQDAVIMNLDLNNYQVANIWKTGPSGLVYFTSIPQSNTLFLVYKEGYEIGLLAEQVNGTNNTFAIKLNKTQNDKTTFSKPSNSKKEFKKIPFVDVAQAQEKEDPDILKIKIYLDDPNPEPNSISQINVLSIDEEIVVDLAKEFMKNNPPTDLSGMSKSSTKITAKNINLDINLSKNIADDLKNLQRLMNNDLGIDNETGFYGTVSRSAISSFNNKYRSNILASIGFTSTTGFYGTVTRSKTNDLLIPVAIISPPDQKENVPPRELGQFLASANPSLLFHSKKALTTAIDSDTPSAGQIVDTKDTEMSSVLFTTSEPLSSTDTNHLFLKQAKKESTFRLIITPEETPKLDVINKFLEQEDRPKIKLSDLKRQKIREQTSEDDDYEYPYIVGDFYGDNPNTKDPVLDAFILCMKEVHSRLSHVISACQSRYGPPAVDTKNYPDLATCYTADSDYQIQGVECAKSTGWGEGPPESENTTKPSAPSTPETYTDQHKKYNCMMDSTPGIKAMQEVCLSQHSVLENPAAYTDCLAATPGYNEAFAGLDQVCEQAAQIPIN